MKKSNPKLKANNLSFEAIGTQWEIDFVAPPSLHTKIENQISKRINEFDNTYSRFLPASWVTRIGSRAGKYDVPKDFDLMHRFYEQMNKLTQGKVTPLIGQVMEGAGYGREYKLVPGIIKKPKPLNEVLDYNGHTLHVKYPCILDYGAAGKGYLVDLVAELLLEQKIDNFLIDAGGDIRHSPAISSLPTPVGLESPDNQNQAVGIVELKGRSLCGSAGNRRKWVGFHHIIDPETLKSVDKIKATWIVADSTMIADGIATCLFFVPPENLQADFDFEYLILKWDNSVKVSNNFPGKLFYEED